MTVTALLPGATDTEFAAVSGLDKTELFRTPVCARSVAEDGYSGMLRGRLNAISGLTPSQRLTMLLTPFIPKRLLLSYIRKLQEATG